MTLKTIADRYEMVRLLGRGGMGAVYEARDTRVGGKPVAIKLLSTEQQDDMLLKRFEREAKAAASINSQNIARVMDADTDPKTKLPYIVMELLDGEDFGSLCDRVGGKLPVDTVLRVAAQALSGLGAAHQAGVVHRDIKPENLFLARRSGDERIVKLFDFGIAKIRPKVDHATQGLTLTGSVMGTPLFMSPEQARGQKDIDARTDIWSLGVVIYAALCGRAPHEDIDQLGALIINICGEPAEPVTTRAPWVPRAVGDIVTRTLRLQPADRYQTAEEMLADVMKVLGHDTTLRDSHLRAHGDDFATTVATESPAQAMPEAVGKAALAASVANVATIDKPSNQDGLGATVPVDNAAPVMSPFTQVAQKTLASAGQNDPSQLGAPPAQAEERGSWNPDATVVMDSPEDDITSQPPPAPVSTPPAAGPPSVPPAAQPTMVRAPAKQSRLGLAVGLAVATVLVLVLVLWLFMRPG
jgi:serine/threonine protein kinase